MTTETMSVHKALAERKTLENRINSLIDTSRFINVNKHSNEKIEGLPVEDYKKTLQGAWDKATDLIKRQEAINRAVTLSNAVTKVKVGEGEYTVAEAIWMKNHGMDFYNLLKRRIETQHAQAVSILAEKNGRELEERAEKYVIGLYGSKEGKTSTEDFEKTKKDFLTSNSYDLIDSVHAQEKIEWLDKKINDFMAEIDAALSVSNAVTEITIEY